MNSLGELNQRTFCDASHVGLGFMIQRDIKMYEDRAGDRRTAPITEPVVVPIVIEPYEEPQEVIDKKGPITMVPIKEEPLPLQPEPDPLVVIPEYEYDPDATIYNGGWYTEVQPAEGGYLTQAQIDAWLATVQPAITGSAEPDSMGPLDVTTTEGEAVVTPRSMRGSGAAGTPLIVGAGRNGVPTGVDVFGAPTTTAQNNAGLLIAAAVAMLVLGG